MPRRFPIRFKLAAALAVPMVTLLGVATTRVLETRQAAQSAQEQAELALSVTGPGSLLRSLQTERNHTGAYLLDALELVDLPANAVDEARPATDEALTEFQALVDERGGQIRELYGPQIEAMGALADVRATVDNFTGTRGLENIEITQVVTAQYNALLAQLFDANTQLSLAIDDPDLRRGTKLVDLSTRNSDLVASLTRELLYARLGGAADGVNTSQEISHVASLLSQLRTNEDAIRTNAVGTYRRYVDALFASEHTQRFPQHVESALDTSEVDITAVFADAGDQDAFGYDSLLEAAEQELETKADALTGDARRTQNLYLILGLAGVLFVALVTWLVSRSITRPLRSLTRQAASMAHGQLPDAVQGVLKTPLGEDVTVPEMTPIKVRTRDEVADVAEALTTVQDSALELAVEQAMLRRNIADSFVSLGRRNQNLLSRQLDFITELEHDEADPDALASLFRLDHLATRMRRNAESLLVLAGVEPPRKWAAPVPLIDVIRAALGEVEDYQRVSVRAVEAATIVGSAAADLAHLLAELAENALTFSPPDQTVEVRGRAQADGYTLAIVDSGLGMPVDDLARANRRLAGAESFTIAPSKYLGHYVTGNLAARHDIDVRLHNSASHHSAGRGVAAIINLPPLLLTADQATAPRPTPQLQAPRRPPAEQRAAVAAPAPAPASAPTPPAAIPWNTPLPSAPGGLPASAPAAGTGAGPFGTGQPATRGRIGRAPDDDLLRALANHRVDRGFRGGSGTAQAPPPAFRPTPPPGTPAAQPPGGAMPTGRTQGGLTRRVHGEQIPNTQPVKVQRATDPAPPPSAAPSLGQPFMPPAARRPPGVDSAAATAMGARRSADDLYSFLSRFSAGVQQGLDHARHDGWQPPAGGNDWRR